MIDQRVNPALGLTCERCLHSGADLRTGSGHVHSACRDRRDRPAERLAAGPGARTSDPATSHEAARSVRMTLTQRQGDVLRVLRRHRGGLTDAALVAMYRGEEKRGVVTRQSESGIRTRRSELVAQGRVRDTGLRAMTASRRNAIVWSAA